MQQKNDVWNLTRFITQQAQTHVHAIRELKTGKKTGCWIWWEIPSPPFCVNGVEQSVSKNNTVYALRDGVEIRDQYGHKAARAYLDFPVTHGIVLRANLCELLVQILNLLQQTDNTRNTLQYIVGSDKNKVENSVILFEYVSRAEAGGGVDDVRLNDVCLNIMHKAGFFARIKSLQPAPPECEEKRASRTAWKAVNAAKSRNANIAAVNRKAAEVQAESAAAAAAVAAAAAAAASAAAAAVNAVNAAAAAAAAAALQEAAEQERMLEFLGVSGTYEEARLVHRAVPVETTQWADMDTESDNRADLRRSARVHDLQRAFVYEHLGLVARELHEAGSSSLKSGTAKTYATRTNSHGEQGGDAGEKGGEDMVMDTVCNFFRLYVKENHRVYMQLSWVCGESECTGMRYRSAQPLQPVKVYNRAAVQVVNAKPQSKYKAMCVVEPARGTFVSALSRKLLTSNEVWVWTTIHDRLVVIEERCDGKCVKARLSLVSDLAPTWTPRPAQVHAHSNLTVFLHEWVGPDSGYLKRGMRTIVGVGRDEPVFQRVASEFPGLTQNEDTRLTLWYDGVPLLGSGTDCPLDSTATLRQSGVLPAEDFCELVYMFQPCRAYASSTMMHRASVAQRRLPAPPLVTPPTVADVLEKVQYAGTEDEIRGMLHRVDTPMGGQTMPVELSSALALHNCNVAALHELKNCAASGGSRLYTFACSAAAAAVRVACELELDSRSENSKISVVRDMKPGQTRTTVTAAWAVKSESGVQQFLAALTHHPTPSSWLFYRHDAAGGLPAAVSLSSAARLRTIAHMHCKLKWSYRCRANSSEVTVFVGPDDTVKTLRSLVREALGVPADSFETSMRVTLAAGTSTTERARELLLFDYMPMSYVEAHLQAHSQVQTIGPPQSVVRAHSVYVVARHSNKQHDECDSLKYHTFTARNDEESKHYEMVSMCSSLKEVDEMRVHHRVSQYAINAYRYKRHVDKYGKFPQQQIETNHDWIQTQSDLQNFEEQYGKLTHLENAGIFDVCDEISTGSSDPYAGLVQINRTRELKVREPASMLSCGWLHSQIVAGRLLYRRPVDGWDVVVTCTDVAANKQAEADAQAEAEADAQAEDEADAQAEAEADAQAEAGAEADAEADEDEADVYEAAAPVMSNGTFVWKLGLSGVVDAMYEVAVQIAARANTSRPDADSFYALRVFALVLLGCTEGVALVTDYTAKYMHMADYVRRALKFDSVHAYVAHMLLLRNSRHDMCSETAGLYSLYHAKTRAAAPECVVGAENVLLPRPDDGDANGPDDDDAMLFRQWNPGQGAVSFAVVWCECDETLRNELVDILLLPPKMGSRYSKSLGVNVHLIHKSPPPHPNKFSVCERSLLYLGPLAKLKSFLTGAANVIKYGLRDHHTCAPNNKQRRHALRDETRTFATGRTLHAFSLFAQLDFDRQHHTPASRTQTRASAMAVWLEEISHLVPTIARFELCLDNACVTLSTDLLCTVTEYVQGSHVEYWRVRGFEEVVDVGHWLSRNTRQIAPGAAAGAAAVAANVTCGELCLEHLYNENTLQMRELGRRAGCDVYSGFVACVRMHAMLFDVRLVSPSNIPCHCSCTLEAFCAVLAAGPPSVKDAMHQIADKYSVNVYLFEGSDADGRDFRSETVGHGLCPWYLAVGAPTNYDPGRNILLRRSGAAEFAYLRAVPAPRTQEQLVRHTLALYANYRHKRVCKDAVIPLSATPASPTSDASFDVKQSFTNSKTALVHAISARILQNEQVDVAVLFVQLRNCAVACRCGITKDGVRGLVCRIIDGAIYVYRENGDLAQNPPEWVEQGSLPRRSASRITADFLYAHSAALYNYELHYADNSQVLRLRAPVFARDKSVPARAAQGVGVGIQLTFVFPWYTPEVSLLHRTTAIAGPTLSFARANRPITVPLPFYEHILSRFGEGSCVFLMHNGLIRTMARVCAIDACRAAHAQTVSETCACTTVRTSAGIEEKTCWQSKSVSPVASYLRLSGPRANPGETLLSMYEVYELVTMQLSAATTRRLIEVYGSVLRTGEPWDVTTYTVEHSPPAAANANALVVRVSSSYYSYEHVPVDAPDLSLAACGGTSREVLGADRISSTSADRGHAGLEILQRVVFYDQNVHLECTHETLLLTRNSVLSRIHAHAQTWRISFICEECAYEVLDSVAARGVGGLPREVCLACVYQRTRQVKPRAR